MHEFQANTRKAVNEIFSLLNKAINESKQITYDLSPPILYELGLIPAFKWRLEQIERTNNIRTKITGEKVDFNFKKDDNIFIYRIVNELLQNAVKHAKASEIDVEIMQKGNKYLISVRDNGIGFKVLKKVGTEKIGGFGLQSIKERLESLRGKLYLKSDPGNFTTATIEIPDKNI
jgi:signal transduction histidine kinase